MAKNRLIIWPYLPLWLIIWKPWETIESRIWPLLYEVLKNVKVFGTFNEVFFNG